jgi:hypothetical protein
MFGAVKKMNANGNLLPSSGKLNHKTFQIIEGISKI